MLVQPFFEIANKAVLFGCASLFGGGTTWTISFT